MAVARLYVGNLPYVAQKADIDRLFAANGIAIKKIDISIDPFNGRNPSYCFVDFHSQEDADRAMEVIPGQEVRGRPVKVNLKTERRSDFGRSRMPTKTHDHGWRVRELPSLDVNKTAYVYDRWARSDEAPSRWTRPQDEGRRVYVGGLPQIPNQDSLNAEMRLLFQGYEIEAVSKMIAPNDDQRSVQGSHHFCFVDLPTTQQARDAVDRLNGTANPYGGVYRVNMARPPKQPTKVMREQLGVESMEDRGAQSETREAPRRNLEGSWRRAD